MHSTYGILFCRAQCPRVHENPIYSVQFVYYRNSVATKVISFTQELQLSHLPTYWVLMVSFCVWDDRPNARSICRIWWAWVGQIAYLRCSVSNEKGLTSVTPPSHSALQQPNFEWRLINIASWTRSFWDRSILSANVKNTLATVLHTPSKAMKEIAS